MSKMSKAVADMQEENLLRQDEAETNFMGGDSYKFNPLDTLKMISASSIFNEPSYYRGGKNSAPYAINSLLKGYSVISDDYVGLTNDKMMEKAIDESLSYDFKATLEWAVELRHSFNMRLNPQVIMVRAALHPDREKFTKEYPGLFDEYNQSVMSRADEPMTQMAYFMWKNKGKKNNMPSILKRSWAKNLSKRGKYHIAKYKNAEIGMINAVRICHANSEPINELMKNGTVEVNEEQMTWENLRSAGKDWKTIFDTVDMGHMALLRNLRGVFTELKDTDREFCNKYLEKLKSGVKDGKQFPFRYYSAYKAVESAYDVHFKGQILDALDECIDLAVENMPKLKGRTMCLSDNSGSAWGCVTSEYGTVRVADIDNLSSVLSACCSDEGYVGKFGDELIVTPARKRVGILEQTRKISAHTDNDVGGNTEGGIWKFFRDAIKNKEHWDNIFIYSDQQAGTGGLYGTYEDKREYRNTFGTGTYNTDMINVFKLVLEYRKKVNPKVNVFSIQTAGYSNAVIPENAYRTALLYGWTGKEALYADAIIKQWDEIEGVNKN